MTTKSPESGPTPFIKQLAANDRPTRDAAVDSLRTYLSGKRVFTKIDLLKLWKGLFYCMWMSDRPRTQQRLVVDLASLVDTMQENTALLFLECFWETMAREWNGIDVLRMDKFLLLVRGYLASSFRYLKVRNWSGDLLPRYMDILQEIPLHPTNIKIPNGIRYHLIDIYLDELEKLSPADSDSASIPDKLPIDILLIPFERLLEKSPTKPVRTRVKEMLGDDRLEKWGYSKFDNSDDEDPGDGDDDEEWTGFV
ncbi:hypothetical protein BDZ91DRAFT_708593 [Kalaharituber pfeilii]|nr:hypothetical protein BDZ91DRAFT_708593 [Kalaharituber pfeilii]